MKKPINSKDFQRFLYFNGYDSNKIQYISRDCNDYKVLDVTSGKEFFIRY